jgi:hypothetical protein
MPWSGGNTGSEESTSGGVTDYALAARGRDNDDDVDGWDTRGRTRPGPMARLVEQEGVHGILATRDAVREQSDRTG